MGCNLKGPLRLGQGTGEKKPSEKQGSLRSEDVSAVGKGKGVSVGPIVQTRGSARKEVKFGSKKMWTTLFPPSSDQRQGFRSRNEPLLLRKPSSDSEELPKEEAFGVGAQWERGFNVSPIIFCRSSRIRKRCSGEGASLSRGEEVVRKPFFEEDRERFFGQVGSDLRGSSATFLPSNPEIRGKGLSFMGNCGMSITENLEVNSPSPSQSPWSYFPISSGLALPFLSPSIPDLPSSVIQSQFPMENRVISEIFSKKDDDGTLCQNFVGNPNLIVVESQSAYSNQLSESFNPIKSKPNLPIEVSNLVTISQGDVMVSPLGEFQIKGLSPRKMVKVRDVLSYLDFKVYSRKKNRCSTGL